MLYIHDPPDYKHYTFIKLYFVVVNYHSSCKCHLLLYGIHFVVKCNIDIKQINAIIRDISVYDIYFIFSKYI